MRLHHLGALIAILAYSACGADDHAAGSKWETIKEAYTSRPDAIARISDKGERRQAYLEHRIKALSHLTWEDHIEAANQAASSCEKYADAQEQFQNTQSAVLMCLDGTPEKATAEQLGKAVLSIVDDKKKSVAFRHAMLVSFVVASPSLRKLYETYCNSNPERTLGVLRKITSDTSENPLLRQAAVTPTFLLFCGLWKNAAKNANRDGKYDLSLLSEEQRAVVIGIENDWLGWLSELERGLTSANVSPELGAKICDGALMTMGVDLPLMAKVQIREICLRIRSGASR